MTARSAIKLLRIKQWAKNLLAYAPMLFAGQWRSTDAIIASTWAFLCLCLLSSAAYIWNDVRDIENDKNHPKKKFRPVASGEVSVPVALGICAACYVVGIGLAVGLLPVLAQVWLAIIAGSQAIYNLALKNVPVVDIVLVTLNFVIRGVVGAAAIVAPVSGWLLFCTGALALMLISAKRRQEFLSLGSDSASRASLKGYSAEFLSSLVTFAACLAVLSYGVYAIESSTARAHPGLILTVPVVLFGVLRYLLLVFASGQGEEPENVMLGDPGMIATLIAFVTVSFLAISDVISMQGMLKP